MADESSAVGLDANQRYRQTLGSVVITVSAIAVLVLGAVVVLVDKAQAQLVFTATLPLLGTWVGTVLAYYFSKDNFEAATRSAEKLLTPPPKGTAIAATKKMIPVEDMYYETGTADTIELVKALDGLTKSKKGNRIPVLDAKKQAVYVIHRSAIDRFLADKAREDPAQDLSKLTLKDMINGDPTLKDLVEKSWITIDANATLGDVKNAMEKTPDCQDVFVTAAGTRTEPVVGWLTNVIVAESSKAS